MAQLFSLGVAAPFMSEDHQDAVVIKPRIMPRDFIDVCLGLPFRYRGSRRESAVAQLFSLGVLASWQQRKS